MFEYIEEIDTLVPWFFPLAVFLFGACWGSFLNVVIYRVPAGKSVIRPGSHCACGQPIAWYDNIPILSWCLLRGKARCCGRYFSFRYPFVELLTGVLFVTAWLLLPPQVALAGFVFIALLIAGTFIDLDTMTLPDQITVGGCIAGVALSFLLPELHGFGGGEPWLLRAIRSAVIGMTGAAVGSGVILWIALSAEAVLRREAMGFGDVILMGCIGAFCGWQGALFAIFGGALLGTLVVIPMMILQKLFGLALPGPGKVVKAGAEGVSAALDKEEAAARAKAEATSKAAARSAGSECSKGDAGSEDIAASSESAKAGAAAQEAAADQQLGMGVAIPFGPWLALGGLVYFLFMRGPTDAYLEALKAAVFAPLGGGGA
ncbi:prepilin peptidase [Ruficoccus amylovorans]|uniref:Prepilin peptidase n=1 Tax=Ruficoccus amylovorans TaxID=1804625 RepID=A0A842HCC9_9BACT|nr:A24 family peptidase [Ruficoccus amylovorans]MBC2593910.1 prepilin peptidase [Ruficoccus amylovorans]